MKKILALLLALIMIVSLVSLTSCGDQNENEGGEKLEIVTPEQMEGLEIIKKEIKVGIVCIGDENDQGYTYNFIRATKSATEALAKEGIKVTWVPKYNLVEGDPVAVANEELAEEGCAIVFNNSYGHEPAMLQVAPDYPNVQFVNFTNEGSWKDDLDNTHDACNRFHEGRYVAGVVAGMKLQEMITKGTIKADEAVIGYVGAYSFAEVVSGYTAYYLGAKSVCPSVTMKVQFVGSWSDAKLEADAAQALIDQGCILISQHSDNTTPATVAQKAGKFHTGYNADMISAAPQASIISTRSDWTNYFVYAIKSICCGKNFVQDYHHGMAEGEVVLTDLNESIAAEGTKAKMEETIKGIIDGSIKVFDTNKFTVKGEKITQCYAVDTDGDFVPDSQEAIKDGIFYESEVMSAPYFNLAIDGITRLNEAY